MYILSKYTSIYLCICYASYISQYVVKVAQSCPTLCDPMDYIQSMEYSRPEDWSGQPFHFSGDLPNPGIKPRSLALQAESLAAEPQGKPKNTGVGSHVSCNTQALLIWGQGGIGIKNRSLNGFRLSKVDGSLSYV